MPATQPIAVFDYEPGGLNELFEFLKRTRNELRSIRKIHISTTFLRVIDVNAVEFTAINVSTKISGIAMRPCQILTSKQ